MKALVGAFNQEKALAGSFSVIVKTNCETDGSSAALDKGLGPTAPPAGHHLHGELRRQEGGHDGHEGQRLHAHSRRQVLHQAGHLDTAGDQLCGLLLEIQDWNLVQFFTLCYGIVILLHSCHEVEVICSFLVISNPFHFDIDDESSIILPLSANIMSSRRSLTIYLT